MEVGRGDEAGEGGREIEFMRILDSFFLDPYNDICRIIEILGMKLREAQLHNYMLVMLIIIVVDD